jgi:hypothetical protein
MSQPLDTGAAAVGQRRTFSLDPSPGRAAGDLEIFSISGVEAVFQWWFESNRRWTERNATNGVLPTTPTAAPPQR